MKTYLITGAAGFIGANFIKYMLAKYPEINCGFGSADLRR